MKNGLTKFIYYMLVGTFCCFLSAVVNGAEYEGKVVVIWIEDENKPDRIMRLVNDFSYIDSTGFKWTALAGSDIDGASIPRLFWDSIGPPFVGDYRRASVVHDYYCDTKTEPWQRVHRMFYEASIVGGVPVLKAKAMYAAVYAKGPRWPEPGELGAAIEPYPDVTDEEVIQLNSWIDSDNPSINEIEERLNSL